MTIKSYVRIILLTFIFTVSGELVLGRNIVAFSTATNDSVQVAGGIAGMGEKVLDLITWERKNYVFSMYPSISVSPRNGFVYGIMPAIKWNSSRQGMYNTIAVNAEHSTKGMLQLQAEHEWYFHPLWLTTGEAFVNSREDLFWVGNPEEELYFDRDELRMEWDVVYNVSPLLWVGGGILINNNRFNKDAQVAFDQDGLAGAPGGLLVGLGPKLVFDSRHRTIAPQKGTYVQLLPLFAGFSGVGDFEYQKITFDVRQYFGLQEETTTLAFQMIVDYASEEIPFFEEPQLGGKERLRGIGHPMRRTGNAVWVTRAEIRQHLWWRVGVVVFAGLGEAGDHFENPFSDLISSVGGGLRFRMLPDDPLNVRFDFGMSSIGTSGFFISLKEAF